MLHSSNIMNDTPIQDERLSRRDLKGARNAIDLEVSVNTAGLTFCLFQLFVEIEML